MSDPIQRAIASSVNQWLQSHPAVFRLVQLLIWASNHPIWSVIVFVVVVAIALSLIKALGRLLELAGLSILKVPFQLILGMMKFSFQSLGKMGSLVFKQIPITTNAELPALQDATTQPTEPDKQQRLGEISTRLETIRQEQNELLQEVAAILSSEN